MDKEQAKKLVKETFENNFNKELFLNFIRNLCNEIDESKAFPVRETGYIKEAFLPYVKTYERLGTYTDPEEKKIDILIVYLQKENSIERARTAQRNFVARYLQKRGEKDAALVAFVSPSKDDWRFSLIKMDYRFEQTENGKIKIKDEFTPARRWSFLVGKNESSHTAQSRFTLIVGDDENPPTLSKLEAAFDIETVTKEFYAKYYALFTELNARLDDILKTNEKVKEEFKAKNIDASNFTEKLLGQIVFLYFLQKKGWFGVGRNENWGTGPKDFLRRLFEKKIINYVNFFNDILEPLFYEALAQQRDYNFYSRFNCKIPFLNGGLFDPINNYDWVHIDILLPNELFSNQTATKEGDKGNGILDILDRYNFTVKEDEPLEKEVAVDPEMLGKVFENLLESNDRKTQGTFYTPREIVHYMCQESLVSYLSAGLEDNVAKNDISKFIKIGELVGEHEAAVILKEKETKDYSHKIPESIRANAKQIDEKLASIKVCDPACGSGAFLVGMMSEIVKARNILSIFMEGGGDRSLYNFKRECIENSLYGVDINAGAVEIAKLRLWLSLIVDEEDIEQIKPLPNLDYKIVRGNSLLGIDLNADLNLFNKESFDEIERYKNSIIEEINHEKKKDLKKKIDELILSITEGKKDFDFEIYFSEVFRNNGGFDIVIANPPYIRQEKIKEYKPLLVKYEVYNSTSDIYTYFYEKSWKILKDGGFSCFISSNKWLRAKYGQKLREFLKSKSAIFDIIDFGGHKVFESATVDTNIIIFQKLKQANALSCIPTIIDNMINALNIQSDFNKEHDLYDYFEKNGFEIKQASLDLNCFTFGNDAVMNIKAKIEKTGVPLKDLLKEWGGKIYRGITTGLNEAFIINNIKRLEILNSCQSKEERELTENIIKPILKGRDINKYSHKWAGLYLLFLPWHFPLHEDNSIDGSSEKAEVLLRKNYPTVYSHLLRFQYLLKKRNIAETGKRYEWYALQRCAATYHSEFEKEKIIFSRIVKSPMFAYDNNGMYINDTSYILTGKNLKYLLAMLNSGVVYNIFYKFYSGGGINGEIKIYKLDELPIPKISKEEQKPIIDIVDKIFQAKAKNQDADTGDFERQIDELVYRLYNLTDEEIKIVEGITDNY